MKPAEHKTQKQQHHHHRKQQQHSLCKGAESPPAPSPTSTEKVLSLIASNYLQTTPPRTEAEHNRFLTYMERMRVNITGVTMGSLVITVRCNSLQILETLWDDYSSGHLRQVVQRCFVTKEILTELNLAALKLKTTISEEEYKANKAYYEKECARGWILFS